MTQTPAAAPRPCAICRKPQVEKYRPFCSKRCADIDLNRWLSGAYAIPGPAVDDEDDGESSSGETGGGGGRRPS